MEEWVGKQGGATAATMNRPSRQSLVATARAKMRGQQGGRRRAEVADGSGGWFGARGIRSAVPQHLPGLFAGGARMMGESTDGLGPLRVLP